MKDFLSKLGNWIKSAYSEPDGSASSTRISIAVLLSFVLGLGLAFGVATFHKMITMDQFNSYLSTAGIFIMTTCGPLYGINKAADAYKNKDKE